MAIILHEAKKEINWPLLLGMVLTLAVIIGGAYFLFFAPTPGIEVLVPTSQKIATQISSVELNSDTVVRNKVFQVLRQYSSPPSGTQAGRGNPFIKY